MAKVLGSSFYFSHVKIDLLKCDPFFHGTDIYVTKICSSYIRVYVSADIPDILIAENTSSCICKYCVQLVPLCLFGKYGCVFLL